MSENDTAITADPEHELDSLLKYWSDIERWLKVAERTIGGAVIPAINELRYSSRQLVAASKLLRQGTLSTHDEVRVRRHLWVGKQYLRNADHDIVDGIVGYVSASFREVEDHVSVGEISVHFPRYPQLRKQLLTAQKEIATSRSEPLDRDQAYEELREKEIKELLSGFDDFVEASVKAKVERIKLNRGDKLRRRFTNAVEVISLLAFLYAVFASDHKLVRENFAIMTTWMTSSAAQGDVEDAFGETETKGN